MARYPGQWTDAASGHIEPGEAPEQAAHRELQEELGVDTHLEYRSAFSTTEKDESGVVEFFHSVFIGQLGPSTELSLKADEVEAVKWWASQDLLTAITQDPEGFTPGLLHEIASRLSA